MNKYKQRIISALTQRKRYDSFHEFYLACGYKGRISWTYCPESLRRAIMELRSEKVVDAKVWRPDERVLFYIKRGDAWPGLGTEAPKPVSVDAKIEQGLKLIAEGLKARLNEEFEEKLKRKEAQISELSGKYGSEVARANKLQRKLNEQREKSYLSKIFGH